MPTRILWLLLILALSACIGNSDTAEVSTQYSVASTQINDIRATATVETARMRTTLDYAATRVSLASTQSTFLQLTLVARGTPIEVLQTYQAQAVLNFATPVPQALPVSADGTLSPQVSPPPTQIIVTPLSAVTQALPADANTPRLENIVTSTGVGQDDCAVGVADMFTTSTQSIYVVGRARNIPRGTLLSSRWLFQNETVITYDFTPDFDIVDACIWFFIDQTDVTFQVGDWAVELDINGTPAAPPTGFNLTDGN